MTDNQQAARLLALWKSGRDKFSSFFAVLEEVRQEVGDDDLARWCREELLIGISAIVKMQEVLKKADAERVRASLAGATESARRQREIERAERAKELAAIRAETARSNAEREKTEFNKKRRGSDRENPDKRGSNASAKRRRREAVSQLSDADLVELIARFRRAEEMCSKANAQWVEGSIAMARVLREMRERHPSNQAFGDWLAVNNINLQSDTRLALTGLGRFEDTRLREILTSTGSRSYQLIWRECSPQLRVVEN